MSDQSAAIPVVTYTPKSKSRGFTWSGFSMRSYLDLLFALVSNQMKVRYRHTIVGLGWALINPLLLMFVYGFVFSAVFSVQKADYKLFLMAGLLPWQAFATGMVTSVRSLTGSRDLIRKAPFPSELLPISAALGAMTNFLIVFAFYVPYLGWRGYPVMSGLHWVVVGILIEAMFLIGLSLIVSVINVYFRDLEQLVSLGVWMLFFLTPIIYPVVRLPEFQAKVVSLLNPMAAVISTIRNGLLRGEAPPLDPLIAGTTISLVTLCFGWFLFRKMQYEVAKAL